MIRKWDSDFVLDTNLQVKEIQMAISSLSRERFQGFNLVKNSK